MNKYLKYNKNEIFLYQKEKIKEMVEVNSIDETSYSDKDTVVSNNFSDSVTFSTSATTGRKFTFTVCQKYLKQRNYYIISKILEHHNIICENIVIISPDSLLPHDIIEVKTENHIFYVIKCSCVMYFFKKYKIEKYVLSSCSSIFHKILDRNIELNPVICINSLEHIENREKIQDYFNCKVIDWITCFDGGLSAWECKCGKYHIDFELANVESDTDNNLLLTDYNNKSTIFFRYYNGDCGIVDNDSLCDCGMQSPILKQFLGRETESFFIRDKKIYGMEIFDKIFPGLNFNNYILIQKDDGSICFYYSGGDKKDLEIINRRMVDMFGSNFIIEEKEDFYFKEEGRKKKRIVRL